MKTKITQTGIRPLAEIVDLPNPEDLNKLIEIGADDFAQVELASIPEGVQLSIDDTQPHPLIKRTGNILVVTFECFFDSKYDEGPYHASVYAKATLNAVKILRADGKPFTNWKLTDAMPQYTVTWDAKFPVEGSAAELFEQTQETYLLVDDTARGTLP